VARVYLAKVRDVPDAETMARMRRGVTVDGERLAADNVRLVESDKNSWVEITLHEGKNHEVRRLLEAVGHPVSKLRRVSIGPLTLRGLEPGEFRALTPQEIQALQKPGARAARPGPAGRPHRSARPPQRKGRPPAHRQGGARPGHADRPGRTDRPRSDRGPQRHGRGRSGR
jgi:hypothetical protein